MDFKAPIDITAVLTAVKKHKDILKAVDKLDASEVLRHFTPVPGITDSLELGKVEGGSISGKYTGKFTAGKYLGKIVPRRLVVRPVVMEMSDEPERYRRTYIAEVPGTLRKEHPFELWLINHGHELASNDLLFAIFTAKYSADEEKTDIQDSFDGIGTIITEGEAVGDISSAEGIARAKRFSEIFPMLPSFIFVPNIADSTAPIWDLPSPPLPLSTIMRCPLLEGIRQ